MPIFKLSPVFKDYIWGGNRLQSDFKFNSKYDKTAEAWMLACHKDGNNTIIGGDFDGKTLSYVIENIGLKELCGINATKFPYFPVLIKLIDAHDNLSVQVHPNDEYAKENENEFGKTEMWYVLDATPDAQLIYGFKNSITKEEFKNSIQNNTLLDKLNKVSIKKGDVFFIEAGTVHAIGKGALIAEIQQNSNTTYRVYDYNRLGTDGKPRQLHIDKAIDVVNTNPPINSSKPMGEIIKTNDYNYQLLTKCDLFTVEKYDIKSSLTIKTNGDSFNHLLITDGCGTLNDMEIVKGDSLFVPANFGEYTINGDLELLLTKI